MTVEMPRQLRIEGPEQPYFICDTSECPTGRLAAAAFGYIRVRHATPVDDLMDRVHYDAETVPQRVVCNVCGSQMRFVKPGAEAN